MVYLVVVRYDKAVEGQDKTLGGQDKALVRHIVPRVEQDTTVLVVHNTAPESH